MLLLCYSANNFARNLEQEIQFLDANLRPLLPLAIDDFTSLTSIDKETDSFVRTFTINLPMEAIDTVAFGHSMGPELVSYVCQTPNQQPLLQLGGRYQFIYEDQAKQRLFDIIIKQQDCGK